MFFDWTHQFCLACDRQTDGAVYCSESCRLADYEKTASTSSSGPSSPRLPSQAALMAARPQQKFYLSPAYDFSNPTPYGTTPQPQSYFASRGDPAARSARRLTPSSSHTSLCSVQSASSTNSESSRQLSDKATRELRAYASSFEQVRMQRRRSC